MKKKLETGIFGRVVKGSSTHHHNNVAEGFSNLIIRLYSLADLQFLQRIELIFISSYVINVKKCCVFFYANGKLFRSATAKKIREVLNNFSSIRRFFNNFAAPDSSSPPWSSKEMKRKSLKVFLLFFLLSLRCCCSFHKRFSNFSIIKTCAAHSNWRREVCETRRRTAETEMLH